MSLNRISALLCVGLMSSFAQALTPLVTGNGLGFAVVDAGTGNIMNFYAHPYKFARPKSQTKDDGEITTNLVQSASWGMKANHVQYLNESHIVRASDGHHNTYTFLPFTLERNVMITASDADSACLNVNWANPVLSRKKVKIGTASVDVVKFKTANERVVIVPISHAGITPNTSKLCGAGFALISVENDWQIPAAVSDFLNWAGSQSPRALIDRELDALERWRVAPDNRLSAEGMKVWRQSETLLRMSQIRERNHRAFGLLLASLPNGNWFIPWVRDMSYATAALIRMGHKTEARHALNAYYNAGPIGTMQGEVRGVPYQISLTRYFGDGSEETDFSGAPYQNLEFDDWGLALWVTGEYYNKYKDLAWLNSPAAHGTVYETARDYVIKPLVANLDPLNGGLIFAVDSSCWEQNWVPRQHYAFSNIAGIGGLKTFLPVAQAMGDWTTVALIQSTLQKMQAGFQTAFVRGDEVHGTLEDWPANAMDASLLEGLRFGVISDAKQVQSTLARMQLLITGSGGYRRVLGTGEYEAHEFLFINFLLAIVKAKMGDVAAADALVIRMEHKAAADSGLIPEMYVSRPSTTYPGAIGDPAGSTPMVGYGAGAYILYWTERP